MYDILTSEVNDATKYALIKSWDQVLSLDLTSSKKIDPEFEEYILQKIVLRNEAKKEKNFALADQIREELLQKNVVLKDTREGTVFEIQ